MRTFAACAAILAIATLAGCSAPPPTGAADDGHSGSTGSDGLTSSDAGIKPGPGSGGSGGDGASECHSGCPASGTVQLTVHITAGGDYEAALPMPRFGPCITDARWADAAVDAGWNEARWQSYANGSALLVQGVGSHSFTLELQGDAMGSDEAACEREATWTTEGGGEGDADPLAFPPSTDMWTLNVVVQAGVGNGCWTDASFGGNVSAGTWLAMPGQLGTTCA